VIIRILILAIIWACVLTILVGGLFGVAILFRVVFP
jgi:hypothetical protein